MHIFIKLTKWSPLRYDRFIILTGGMHLSLFIIQYMYSLSHYVQSLLKINVTHWISVIHYKCGSIIIITIIIIKIIHKVQLL